MTNKKTIEEILKQSSNLTLVNISNPIKKDITSFEYTLTYEWSSFTNNKSLKDFDNITYIECLKDEDKGIYISIRLKSTNDNTGILKTIHSDDFHQTWIKLPEDINNFESMNEYVTKIIKDMSVNINKEFTNTLIEIGRTFENFTTN